MLKIDAELIGHRSEPIQKTIELGAVARFVRALGATNRIHHDRAYAIAHGHRDLVAPPTYAVTLLPWHIPGVTLPEAGVLHGEQAFEWESCICVGDSLTVVGWAQDVKSRQAKMGRMTIISVAAEATNQDLHVIFRSTAVVVVTEEVAHADR